jgi:translation initiation factor IF-1
VRSVKEELVTVSGTVVHRLKNALIIALDGGPQVRAVLSGRMLGNGIRVVAGNRVNVEMSRDLTLGRVTHRF